MTARDRATLLERLTKLTLHVQQVQRELTELRWALAAASVIRKPKRKGK